MDEFDEKIFEQKKVNLGERLITQDEIVNDPKLRGQYMMQKFFKAGMMHSIDNEHIMQVYFHTLMGAFFCHYNVIKPEGSTDPRVNIFWVQDSGSGKSQMNKFLSDIGNRIGLTVGLHTSLNTSSLVGSYDPQKHAFNVKNNLTKGMTKTRQKKNGETEAITYMDPAIKGSLGKFDIMLVDEAKIMVQKGPYTEGLLSEIQPAFDHPGNISKTMAQCVIEYMSRCSIIATTTDFKELGSDVLKQGFFARVVFYIRKLSLDDRQVMQNEYHKHNFNPELYAKTLTDFMFAIERHPFPLLRQPRKVIIKESMLPIVNANMNRWSSILRTESYGADTDVLSGLMVRANENIFKIASQMAIINHSITEDSRGKFPDVVYVVGEEEITYAVNLMNNLFADLRNNVRIDEDAEFRKHNLLARSVMQKMLKMQKLQDTKDNIINSIMDIMKCGRSRATKNYNFLVATNYLSEKKDGRTITVTPKWDLYSVDMGIKAKEMLAAREENFVNNIQQPEQGEDEYGQDSTI